MSRILVTGGAGFIGANLVRALQESGDHVRVLDDLSVGRLDYLKGVPVEVIRGSILNTSLVRRAARGMDAVVHLAALSGVAPSVARPDRDFDINVRGTFNVLDAARRRDVSRVVFASTGAVLAGTRPPLHEQAVPRPRSPYGASKLYGEGALQAFGSVYGITTFALRFSNVYGPYCAHKQSVVAAFLRRALRRQPLVIYGTGRQTRDFLYVDDVTAAIRKSLSARRGGLYQLGTGQETSVRRLAGMITEVTGRDVTIEQRPSRPGEATRNYADIGAAVRALRWRPRVPLREGLAATFAWLAQG